MKSFLEILNSEVLLFDGAMGTQLIDAGMKRGESSEKWILDQPDVVEKIHSSYVMAGARVITTNSFTSTRKHLSHNRLQDRMVELNTGSVRLAIRAADSKAFVAGDVGPTGHMFPPMGKADESLLIDTFTEQIEILDYSGVDLILIETQYDLREAAAALKASKQCCKKPVGVTMTFKRTKRGYFTMIGDNVERSINTLADLGADFAGTNCTLSPDDMIPLTEELSDGPLPILVQPNAGQPEVRGDQVHYGIDPLGFATSIKDILSRGARAVGGCCGTTPEHIRVISALMDSKN